MQVQTTTTGGRLRVSVAALPDTRSRPPLTGVGKGLSGPTLMFAQGKVATK